LKRALAFAAFLLASAPAAAAPPPDLKDWELHCYCLGARQTPQSLVRANGAILLRAKSGVPASAIGPARRALLARFGLVRRAKGRLWTAFPILGPEVTAPLRARAAFLGRVMALRLAPDVAALREILAQRGQSQSAYALTVGYALDTLLWAHLKGAVPPTRPDARHPLWRGVFWAMWPRRAGGIGTNEIAGRGGLLVMVWADPVAARLKHFAATRAARRLPTELGASMPLVREQSSDPLFRAADAIAARMAAALTGADGAAMLAALPGLARQDAMVIAAHEAIWAVADTLVSSGQLTVPAVLKGANGPLDPLLFVRRKR
jgi:hypothetical protein